MSAIKLRSLKNGLLALLSAVSLLRGQLPSGKEKHLLYVASPGIRNYQEYGGVGVLVFDIDGAFRFVKRLPTRCSARTRARKRQGHSGKREDRPDLRYNHQPDDGSGCRHGQEVMG